MEPVMNLKAFNGRVVAAWLAESCVLLSSRTPGHIENAMVAGCMNLASFNMQCCQ